MVPMIRGAQCGSVGATRDDGPARRQHASGWFCDPHACARPYFAPAGDACERRGREPNSRTADHRIRARRKLEDKTPHEWRQADLGDEFEVCCPRAASIQCRRESDSAGRRRPNAEGVGTSRRCVGRPRRGRRDAQGAARLRERCVAGADVAELVRRP